MGGQHLNWGMQMVDTQGITYSPGDIDLRHMTGKHARHFCYRGDFQRSTNDNDQIYFVTVMANQALSELIGKIFAKEGDVRLK